MSVLFPDEVKLAWKKTEMKNRDMEEKKQEHRSESRELSAAAPVQSLLTPIRREGLEPNKAFMKTNDVDSATGTQQK